MLLRDSEFKQSASFNKAWQLASGALDNDEEGYRTEFLQMVKNAQSLAKQQKKKPVAVEEEEDEQEVSIRRN